MKKFTAFLDGKIFRQGDTWSDISPPRNLEPLPEGLIVYRNDGVWLTLDSSDWLGQSDKPVFLDIHKVPKALRVKVLLLS